VWRSGQAFLDCTEEGHIVDRRSESRGRPNQVLGLQGCVWKPSANWLAVFLRMFGKRRYEEGLGGNCGVSGEILDFWCANPVRWLGIKSAIGVMLDHNCLGAEGRCSAIILRRDAQRVGSKRCAEIADVWRYAPFSDESTKSKGAYPLVKFRMAALRSRTGSV